MSCELRAPALAPDRSNQQRQVRVERRIGGELSADRRSSKLVISLLSVRRTTRWSVSMTKWPGIAGSLAKQVSDLLPNEYRPTGTRARDLTRRAVESPSWR